MVEGFDEDLRTALWGRNSPAGMLIRKRTLRPLEGGIGLLKNDDEKGAIGMLKWRALLVAVALSVFVACPAMAADANESSDTVLDNAVHEGFVSEDENVNAALAVAQRVHDAFVASFGGDFVFLDKNDFASDYLYQQVEGRNAWCRHSAAGYDITDKESASYVDGYYLVNDHTMKVVISYAIHYNLNTGSDNGWPDYTQLVSAEGMVLTKQDGVWKVSRLIDNMYRANDDAINAFYENLESADTDGSVPSAAQIVKDMTFQDYISLWDENVGDTPQIYWDGVELEFPDQQPIVQNGVSLAPSRPIVAAMPGEYTVNILQSDPWWKISVEPVGTEPDYWLTFSQGHDGLLPSYTVDYGTADNYDPAQHKEATMNVPVQIVGDRLMLPVRALIEPFTDVVWDCGSNIIYIISR